MCAIRMITGAFLGLAMLSLGACATPQQSAGEQAGSGTKTVAAPPSQVTQSDIAALRAEIASLRREVQNISQQSRKAVERAEAAARAAEAAAAKAKKSASKSNRIYTESLQK